MHDTSSHVRLDSLTRRLARLERRNLVLGRLCLLLTAAVFALPLLAWSTRPAAEPEIRAERFVLVDADGKVRGLWQSGKSGHARFDLIDPQDRTRYSVTLEDDEVTQVLRGADGRVRLGHAVDTGQHPHVVLNDGDGKPRLHLSVNHLGSPNLLCVAKDGTMPAGVGILDDGRPWSRPEPAVNAASTRK